MSLADRLRNDLKDAMRAKDEPRVTAIRLLLSSLKHEEGVKHQRALDQAVKTSGVELRNMAPSDLPPAEPLTESEMNQILAREIKKRQEAVEAYRKAGRGDLVAAETAAQSILQAYLPAQMDSGEARARVAEIIDELRGDRPSLGQADMKRVMPVVMERLRDRVDGRTLNQLVRELLAS